MISDSTTVTDSLILSLILLLIPCTGEYTLNLSNPFERAILYEILHIINHDPTFEISKSEYKSPNDGSFQSLKLIKFNKLIDESSHSSATRIELHNLRAFELLVKYNWKELNDIVEKHCSLGKSVLAATSTSHDIDADDGIDDDDDDDDNNDNDDAFQVGSTRQTLPSISSSEQRPLSTASTHSHMQ